MIKKIDLDVRQVERLVDCLSPSDKIRLFRRLGQQTAVERMKEIFKEIDEQRKKFPISAREIRQGLTTVREKIYGPHRR